MPSWGLLACLPAPAHRLLLTLPASPRAPDRHAELNTPDLADLREATRADSRDISRTKSAICSTLPMPATTFAAGSGVWLWFTTTCAPAAASAAVMALPVPVAAPVKKGGLVLQGCCRVVHDPPPGARASAGYLNRRATSRAWTLLDGHVSASRRRIEQDTIVQRSHRPIGAVAPGPRTERGVARLQCRHARPTRHRCRPWLRPGDGPPGVCH